MCEVWGNWRTIGKMRKHEKTLILKNLVFLMKPWFLIKNLQFLKFSVLLVYYTGSFPILECGHQRNPSVLQRFNGTNLQLWQNDRGRNAPVRVQQASIIIPKHHLCCETRYDAAIWFQGLYVLQLFKDPHEVHKLLVYPDCQAPTKFKENSSIWMMGRAIQCKMCKVKSR